MSHSPHELEDDAAPDDFPDEAMEDGEGGEGRLVRHGAVRIRGCSTGHGTSVPRRGRRQDAVHSPDTWGSHPTEVGRERQGRVTKPLSTIQSKATSAGSSPSTSTRRLSWRSSSSVSSGEIWSKTSASPGYVSSVAVDSTGAAL